MPDYMTFGEIVDEVERLIKHFQSGQESMVKAVINMVYRELLNSDDLFPMHWAMEMVESHNAVSGPISVDSITKADPVVVTATAHGLVTGDIVSIYGLTEMTELNNRSFHFTRVDADSGSLQDLNTKVDIDSSAFVAAEATGGDCMVHRGITLSNQYRQVVSAGFHGYDPMDPITLEQIERDTNWWDAQNLSRPTRFFHKKTAEVTAASTEIDMLFWFPAADGSYDLRLWAERRPAKLSADADVPHLPPEYHYAIVAGAVTRLAESNVQVENAVVWPNIYAWNLNGVKADNRRWWRSHEYKTHQEKGRKPYLL